MGDQFHPSAPVVIQAEATAQSNFSLGTVAQIKAGQEQLIAVRRSMLDDMARRPFTNPEEGMLLVMDLQQVQSQLNALEARVSAQSSPKITSRDLELMRSMKRDGDKETTIAARFGTNQTKVNRLLNGVQPVDSEDS